MTDNNQPFPKKITTRKPTQHETMAYQMKHASAEMASGLSSGGMSTVAADQTTGRKQRPSQKKKRKCMTILPVKISKYFNNKTALRIINEDILIVAPVVAIVPFHEKSRESLQVDEDDFDKSYSNETGFIHSKTPTIISSILVCSNSYSEIDSAHCMPFFSQRASEEIHNHDPITGKTADLNIDGMAMECENLAYLLTLMGREIYLPLHLKGRDNFNPEIKKSRLNEDILPGYVCYKYNPGEEIQSIAVVKQEVLKAESNNEFISPIDANEYVEFSVKTSEGSNKNKTDFSIAQEIIAKKMNSHETINALHKAGIISSTAEEMEEIRKEIEDEGSSKQFCPDCKRKISDKQCFDCGIILGRRGWRQMGVYDG